MEAERSEILERFLGRLGVRLGRLDQVEVALTHPTFAFENKDQQCDHNQRMEFLGDAVIGLVVAEYLYHFFPDCPEGDLTKMRAAIVCEATLANRGRQLGLGFHLLLGKGEELTGGRERNSNLADAFEAMVGAIFLENGLEAARSFIVSELENELKALVPGKYGDYKTRLQELVQKRFNENVNYAILEEHGPDHDKRFVVGVSLHNRLLARGGGRSKKEAEQQAAQQALELVQRLET